MKKPIISIIAALSQNRVIGKDNKIPWHLKEDLIRLKRLTLGHVVIVGKNSYESMLSYYQKSGKPTMSQRIHLVVTSDPSYVVDKDKGLVVHSVEEALEKAWELEKEEVFIIGGARIFQSTIHLVDRLYLTIIKEDIEGDTYFPDYNEFTKIISQEQQHNERYSYEYLVLQR